MQLQIFTYKEQDAFGDLTTIEIDGEIWFAAPDVCAFLDIRNVSDAVSSLEEDEKLVSEIPRAGQMRKVNLINESGLYALVFRSRKETARRFRKWVTKEVIPSIRKTGGYGINRLERPDFIIRYMENFDQVEKGHFSVINQLYISLYARLEHLGYQIPNKAVDGVKMRPDVSVGRGFSDYLKEHYPDQATRFVYYKHKFPDIAKEFDCRQYPNDMMHLFIEYVEDVWIPNHAQSYFKTRDLKALDYLPKLLSN